MPATPRPRRLVDIQAAAEYVGVNPKTIRRRIADGTLPALRVAGTRGIRIDLAEVEKMLRPIPAAAGGGR